MVNLIEFLKSDEGSRKIFGERELKIIEKQLLGINLTQSEKNRLSRDIRKKFDFIKKVSLFTDDFDLKKGATIKENVNNVKEIILKSSYFSNIKRIILFGSAVENNLTFRSDIDIAVEFFSINSKEATRFRVELSGKVDSKVDLQVYNILPEKIKKEISEKGRVIYEQQNR